MEQISDIRKIRTALGMSQDDFAKYFHIPRKTLINWDSGRRKPAPYIVRMIITILILQGEITKSPLDDE